MSSSAQRTMQLAASVDVTPANKLTIVRQIGRGGFGDVYYARHSDWSEVAYKKLRISYIGHDERAAHELKSEVAIHIRLRHPNVITLIGVVFESHNYGVVLEYAPHGDFRYFLNKFRPVHWAWKLRVSHEVSLAMNYLHTALDRPLIHGDLKINNVLIGYGYHAKITDFGLSRWKRYSYEVSGRQSNEGGGTVTHIPPENWRDINRPRDQQFDVYGFAVLLWETFSEQRPFHKLSAVRIRDDVQAGRRPASRLLPVDLPDYVKELIAQCWAQDPADRPVFSAIKDRLERWCKQLGDFIHEAERTLQRQEHANSGVLSPNYPSWSYPVQANTQRDRRLEDAFPAARSHGGGIVESVPAPVQSNYFTQTDLAQVIDRSGVPSARNPTIDLALPRQAVSGGFQYEELAYPVSVGRLSEPIATGDGSSSFITLNRFTHQHDATLQSPNTTPDSSSSRQPVQVNDDSSRRSSCMTALQHQTAELRISDDPVSSQRDEGVVLSMETTEAVPNVVPREETTSNLEQSAGASSSDLPEM